MSVSQRLYLVDPATDQKLLLATAVEGSWLPVEWLESHLREWLICRDGAAVAGTGPTNLILKTEGVNN